MSPTSPTAATQTFSATIKNKYMRTMRSKKNVPKISDRQRLGTRKAQYVGMVILACFRRSDGGEQDKYPLVFPPRQFFWTLGTGYGYSGDLKKNGVLPKGSRTYDSPDALQLSHGRLVGATKTVGSYNKLLQPVASFSLNGLSIIIDHVLVNPSPLPLVQVASYTRPCSEHEEQLWMEGERGGWVFYLADVWLADFQQKEPVFFRLSVSTFLQLVVALECH